MLADNTDDLYREDAKYTKHVVDRTQYYVNLTLEKGDFIRQESPGVLQIKILKPKKAKKDKPTGN